ncbi:MAG TPA: hypothetical protein VIV11_00930 [Kofleriaceae bacterium]
MKRLLIALALVTACKKQDDKTKPQPAPQMPAEEVKRSEDACKTYVERVCACATQVPDVAKQCELSRALPEAVRIGLEIAASPDSTPDIVQQSYASVRKTAKECIEQLAKLPALGCQ